MNKKRQHYVWQNYLRSWANQDSQLYCLRDNNIFPANTSKVAVKKYFYKMEAISQEDIMVYKSFFVNHLNDAARDFACELLNIFETEFKRIKGLQDSNPEDPEIDSIIKNFRNDFEEQYHEETEKDAKEYLRSLSCGKLDVLQNQKSRSEFILFLMIQYVRTEKIANNILMAAKKHTGYYDSIRRTMIFFRIIQPSIIAESLNACAATSSYKLLCNVSDTPFITGDQPVINIKADEIDDTGFPKYLELYYPVSPEFAVLINPRYGNHICEAENVGEDDVKKFNDMIVKGSYKQVYAKEEVHLKPYVL